MRGDNDYLPCNQLAFSQEAFAPDARNTVASVARIPRMRFFMVAPIRTVEK